MKRITSQPANQTTGGAPGTDPFMSESQVGVFDPSTLRISSEAFDKAWDFFLKGGELTPKNLDTSRSRLAQLILEEVNKGELNSHTIARSAIGKLRQGDLLDKAE